MMLKFFVKEKQGNDFILSNEIMQHIKVTRIKNKQYAIWDNVNSKDIELIGRK